MSRVLYGVNGLAGGTSSLYVIDTVTGAATLIGSIGFPTVQALACHPIADVLYGLSRHGVNAFDLITINPATGAGTFVAALSPSAALDVSDMAFDASGACFFWNEAALDRLATVNLVTGAWANRGPSSFVTVPAGLAFKSTGVLYVKSAQTVCTCNTTTGLCTFLSIISGIGFPGAVSALAFSAADVGYTIQGTSGNLYVLNAGLTTGTVVGATGVPTLDSLAFGPVPPAGPPPLCLNAPPLADCWDATHALPPTAAGTQPTEPARGGSWTPLDPDAGRIGLITEDEQP